MKQLANEEIALISISTFWESIFDNLKDIPLERRGGIYRHAKKQALEAIHTAKRYGYY